LVQSFSKIHTFDCEEGDLFPEASSEMMYESYNIEKKTFTANLGFSVVELE
jgi:hypothetical protein